MNPLIGRRVQHEGAEGVVCDAIRDGSGYGVWRLLVLTDDNLLRDWRADQSIVLDEEPGHVDTGIALKSEPATPERPLKVGDYVEMRGTVTGIGRDGKWAEVAVQDDPTPGAYEIEAQCLRRVTRG